MSLPTSDPFRLRQAGWMLALATPAALFFAYDVRKEAPGMAVIVVILALILALISAWSFIRASRADGSDPGGASARARGAEPVNVTPPAIEVPKKKPLTKGRLATAILFFALGVAALAFRESDAAAEVPIEVYASLLLLFGAALLAFAVLASDSLLQTGQKPGRQSRPRTLRIFYAVTGAGLIILGLAGLLA